MTAPSAEPPLDSLFPVPHSWKIASLVASAMVLLALVGVALSTTSSSAAQAYWIALVPVYGLLCLGIAWTRARQEGGTHRPEVIRQVLHWLGIGVALGLNFVVRGSGEETATATGLNALLLLALGCYLAGIHLEWMFVFVGLLLTAALIVVTKAQQYLWLIFVVGFVAVIVMLAVHWLLERHGSSTLTAEMLRGKTRTVNVVVRKHQG
jgi:hypothetical protein